MSELQQTASLACGPELPAGARCPWTATLATLPGWELYASQPLDGCPWLLPAAVPPQAAVLSSLWGSIGRCCGFKLFPY